MLGLLELRKIDDQVFKNAGVNQIARMLSRTKNA